jgi:thiol-disulfide isomerase/thioredoxin
MKSKSIILAIFVVAALVIIGGLAKKSGPPGRAVEGLPAPPVLLKELITGKTVTMDDFKSKAVFINFWATWCGPCVEEMPSIQKLYEARKSDPSIKMVMILYKDDPQAAVKFMKENKYDFDVYIDDNSVSAKAFGLTGVPETFLIDNKGIVFKRILGPHDWNAEEAGNLLGQLVSRNPSQ